jgi:hypothetical protein
MTTDVQSAAHGASPPCAVGRPGGDSTTETANEAPESKEPTSHDTPGGYHETTARDDLTAYLDVLFGVNEGRVHLAFGAQPRVENGRYRNDLQLGHYVYKWPQDVDKVTAKIHAAEWDVHVCPYLLTERKRSRGTSVETARTHVHTDVDLDGGHVDLEAVRAIPGGFAIGSGTPGNAHVYVPLSKSVSLSHHERLCQALGVHFGTLDPSKFRDNDLLRPPGTFNFKPTVMDDGRLPPTPVTWLVRPSDSRIDPKDLAMMLGLDLDDTADPDASSGAGGPAQADTEVVPNLRSQYPKVHTALTVNTGDRSADAMRIVSSCKANGLSLAQARWVIASRRDLAERLEERHDDDVARCWERAEATGAEWCGQRDGMDDTDDAFAAEVATELRKLRIRETARQQLASEKNAPTGQFDAGLLDEILARPEEPPYRIYGLLPADGAMLVVAQRKTGKTTLMLNLARSLITGEPLLGRFTTVPARGRVAILNYEVSGGQLGRWAEQVDVPSGRLMLVNLRGRRDPLAHRQDRDALAALLRQHEVESLIVDPFGRAYSGDDQNSPGKVGAWLVDLDTFTRSEIGARDLILTAHAGWNGERARGASALEDWADSIVTMTMDKDGKSRYLRAIGRDVSVDEDLIQFDPDTKLISLTGFGNRRQATDLAAVETMVVQVCDHLKTNCGASFGDIDKAVEGRQTTKRRAIDLAEERGQLRRVVGGTGKSNQHYLVESGTS